ncbi:MAG: hypothetical protein A2176_03130 [Spirochaetes bacterium RBG_13_51_14]|nr:MAG: hypothetical protein A2176_03130 [Spirochaetes bacterium RBG_13_51_14]
MESIDPLIDFREYAVMVIAQLLKILFIAVFIYMVYNLISYLFKLGKALRDRQTEDEKRRQQRMRNAGPGRRNRSDVIELDKDQYKVE